jgi:hypothetical protein
LLPKPNALHSTLLLFNFEITVASKKNNEREDFFLGIAKMHPKKKKFFFPRNNFFCFSYLEKNHCPVLSDSL